MCQIKRPVWPFALYLRFLRHRLQGRSPESRLVLDGTVLRDFQLAHGATVFADERCAIIINSVWVDGILSTLGLRIQYKLLFGGLVFFCCCFAVHCFAMGV